MTAIRKKSLTICMPALNESMRISKTLTEVYKIAKESLDEFEIVVVDDGSTDNTSEVVLNLKEKLGSEIKLIRKERNEGLGYAFKVVVENAQFEYITTIVSDNAFPAEGMKKFFLATASAPVIVGYRSNFSTRPCARKIISRCVTKYVELLCGKKIIDAQGLILCRLDLCKEVPFIYARYNVQMQIASLALNSENEFIEVPVTYAIKADQHSGMMNKRVLIDVLESSFGLLLLKITGKLRKK